MTGEVRQALRSLLTAPVFTATAVGTVALVVTIAATGTAVVDRVLLRPLPLPQATHIVALCERKSEIPSGYCIAAPPNVADLAARLPAIAVAGVAREWAFSVRVDGTPQATRVGIASPGVFEVAGLRPTVGRLFNRSEIGAGRDQVILISHRFRRDVLASDPDVAGRVLHVDGKPHTIVGVLPDGPGVPTLEEVDLWKPLPFALDDETNRSWAGFVALARLRSASSPVAFARDVAALTRSMGAQHFADHPEWAITPLPVTELVVGSARRPLLLFLAAATFVLLIGYSNVAALFLARGSARARDTALRVALGASRWCVARHVLIECAMVAVAGTLLGVLAATWLADVVRWIAPAGVPRLDEIGFDWRVLLLASIPSIALALLFAGIPASRTARSDPRSALAGGGRTSSTSHGHLGAVLVALQTALAVALVAASVLLGRSFATQLAWSPGFDRDRLLTVWGFFPGDDGRDATQRFSRLADSLRALPDVEATTFASAGPLFGGVESEVVRTGTDAVLTTAQWRDAGPAFFSTLGVPIVRGRDLTSSDDAGARRVAIINERLAALAFGLGNPLGQVLRLGDDRREVEVVGVAQDVPGINGLPPGPEITWPMAQAPRMAAYLLVRTRGNAAAQRRSVQALVARADPLLQASEPRALTEQLDRLLRTPRFASLLAASLGFVGLLLALIGTYGLHAYVVAQRRREFGVRLALGGSPGGILRGVLSGAVRLSLVGVALGVPLAMGTGQLLRGQLTGVGASDPRALAVGAAALLVASLAAAWGPAHRAMRVDPVEAMRSER